MKFYGIFSNSDIGSESDSGLGSVRTSKKDAQTTQEPGLI